MQSPCHTEDCVYPCRTARFGTALVRSGQLRLTSAEFAQDFRPLEVNGKGGEVNGKGWGGGAVRRICMDLLPRPLLG